MKKRISYFVLPFLGAALLAASIFFLNADFLQNFAFISPDKHIASQKAKDMILLARVVFAIAGLALAALPLYASRFPKFDRRILRRRDNKPLILAMLLIIVLVCYFSCMFISGFYFIKSNERPTGKLGIFLYSYETTMQFLNTFISIVSTKELDMGKVDLPVYNLFIKQEDIDMLNSNLPASGEEYVDGYLIYGNDTYSIKARYRGDSKLHWYFKKKSWRINIKDGQAINSMDKFNLINPKYKSHMQTLLGYYVSDKLGLITPRSYHVIVFLNNDYQGVYYYSDQIDESFISMLGKAPGDIYFGDTNQSLFNGSDAAGVWDIMSTYDGNKGRARQNIMQLISAVNSPDIDFYRFFNRYLGDDYLKFYSYNVLIGDAHVSEAANHKFYFDPENKIFEPIVWDQITFSDTNMTLEPEHNSLFDKVSRIPQYIHIKNLYLKQFMEELPESMIMGYIDNTSDSIEYEITHDKYKDSPFPPWTLSNSEWKYSVQELKDSVNARYDFIRKELNKTDINVSVAGSMVVFDVGGVSAVEAEPAVIFNTIFNGTSCPKVYKDTDLDLAAEASEMIPARCSGNKVYLGKQLLYPGKNGTLRYTYIIESSPGSQQIFGVSIDATNSITGSELSPTVNFLSSASELPPVRKTESIHPWMLGQS